MGKRGFAKRPTALTVLIGNPGKRAINKDEPQPEAFIGAPPARLSAAAKAIWERCAPDLLANGLLTVADIEEFVRYCRMQAQFDKAMDFIEEHGQVYVKEKKIGEDGEQKTIICKFPQVFIAKEYGNAARQIAAKFGMTPSDRTSLKGSKPKEHNALAEFLSKKV